ncbi:hypothetical protein [Sorangium sp. So ce1153]|uniref:hypothetical protein n=1 Tax=Sorangium sp. So ce1153 TaxID=3133333 RepID=UPI003F63B837
MSSPTLYRAGGPGPAGAFELPLGCFYKVRDGLIVERWIHVDPGDLARALGMGAHEKTP